MWRSSSRQVIAASTTTTTTTTTILHSRSLCTVSRLAPHPPDLLKWVRREGGFVHQAVTIANAPPYGLGLVAAREIPKGSDLIGLPKHVPLRFDDGSGSVLDGLAQRVPEELWAMRLGLRLLQERAKTGSFWWPYISNLPEAYSVPIFFQGEDIKNLQYAPLLHQVNKRCRFLLEFEKEVKDALANLKPEDHPFGGQDVDASSLGWAMTAVSSRAFRLHGVKLSGKALNDVPMMLPLIDMCNHSFDANAKIIQDPDAENSKMIVKVVAEKDIGINEPLELNYGCLSNDFFLLDYGFVVPANPYDCIELRYDAALLVAVSTAAGFSSPSFSSPAPWQREILTRLKFDGEAPDLKVAIGGPGLVEGRFLAAVRVLHSDNEETVRKHDLSTLQSLSEAPLGTQNETAALRTIVGLCATVLQHFPTKITEDESLLKQEGLSSSTELALQFRVQKKALIVNVMMELLGKIRDLSKPKSQESPTASQI